MFTHSRQAFKEFVETFQEAPSTVSKVWVKAGTYDAGSRRKYAIMTYRYIFEQVEFLNV